MTEASHSTVNGSVARSVTANVRSVHVRQRRLLFKTFVEDFMVPSKRHGA
jgi:hypothetical protein